MKDLALDRITHDLIYGNADLALVDELDQVEQNLKERLLFYKREWFLDGSAGIPLYDDILVKNPNVPNIESILKAEILDTPDVTALLEFKSVYDSTGRHYGVEFTVRTKYGTTSLETSIF